MSNSYHSERLDFDKGFSSPKGNSVDETRSRFARAFDFVLHGTSDIAEEGAKAAPHLGKITHHTIAAPVRFVIAAITGKAKK